MELPPIALPPAHPAGAAAPAPGDPAAADAAAPLAPGFAELLAAGLALPAITGEADSGVPSAPPDATETDAGATASGAADPTLALILASIARLETAAPAAGTAIGNPSSVGLGQASTLEAPGSPLTPWRAEPAIGPEQPVPLAAQPDEATAAAPRAAGLGEAAAPLPPAQIAPAHLQSVAAANGPAVAGELRAPVGADGWDAQVGRTVVWMATERHQVAEVRLNPPDLGPMEIVLRLSGDDGSQASVTFASPHPEVRAALEAALPRLREMLAESGIMLAQADVNAESFQDAGGARQSRTGGDGAPEDGRAASAPPRAVARAGAGLVDIFA